MVQRLLASNGVVGQGSTAGGVGAGSGTPPQREGKTPSVPVGNVHWWQSRIKWTNGNDVQEMISWKNGAAHTQLHLHSAAFCTPSPQTGGVASGAGRLYLFLIQVL
jgi:hypothetical protein